MAKRRDAFTLITVVDPADTLTAIVGGVDAQVPFSTVYEPADAKVDKAGDTMTGNLVIVTTFPGVQLRGDAGGLIYEGADGDRRAVLEVNDGTGVVSLQVHDVDGVFSHSLFVGFIDTGVLDLSENTTVTVPTPVNATDAAQKQDVDAVQTSADTAQASANQALTDLATVQSGAWTQVLHGADDTAERPTGWLAIIWIGTVTPANGVAGDLYIDSATGLVTVL